MGKTRRINRNADFVRKIRSGKLFRVGSKIYEFDRLIEYERHKEPHIHKNYPKLDDEWE